MSEAIKEKTDAKTATEIVEIFNTLSVPEQMEVLRLLITPKVRKQMSREKDMDELFKTMEELWELNKDVDEDELEKDIQEAVDHARSKNV